jgi:hypothetical protein
MAYRVEFAARAARDLEILYVEKNVLESQAAARWYNGLEEAVFAQGNASQSLPCCPGDRKAQAKASASALRQKASCIPGHL